MGVYRPAKSRFWHYDFVIKGRRFHGSTGQEGQRAAERIERQYREEAAAGRLGAADQFTLNQACGKFWLEKGQYNKPAGHAQAQARLDGLLALLGPTTRLCDLTTRKIAEAVQRRRETPYTRQDGGTERYIGAATIKRSIIIPLRAVLNRARRVWGAKGLPEIAWDDLTPAQPGPSLRWYSADEQAAWIAQAQASDPACGLFVRMLLRYGMRFEELFFHIDRFDPTGPRLFLPGSTRKADVPHVLPLRQDDGRELAARIGRARAAGLSIAWFTEDQDGDLIEMTYHGLYSRIRRAAAKARIRGGRIIHGARHHAATELLRTPRGSLAMAGQLLGHADPKSTAVYAHILEDDLRAALEGQQQGLELDERDTPVAGPLRAR